MSPRSSATEPPEGNEDAFLAVTTVGPYVNNADTKIGFLATALTVLTTGVVRQRPRVEALIDGGVGVRDALAMASLTTAALSIALAGAWLFLALKPRLTNPHPSRFAFPHLATADLATLAQPDPPQARAEAWTQAQTLSQILLHKYTYFNKALGAGLGAGVAFIGWLLQVPS